MEIRIQDNENLKGDEDIVYDIDKGLALVKKFIVETSDYAKDFKKIAKKFNGTNPKEQKKQTSKFVKEKLLKRFIFIMKEFFLLKELEILNEEELVIYIAGIFIIGNSNDKKIQKDKLLCQTIYEITKKALEK